MLMAATRVMCCRSCGIEKPYPGSFYTSRRICSDCFSARSRAYFNRRKSGRRHSESAAWDGATIRAARYKTLLRYFSARKTWYEIVLVTFFKDRAGYSLDFIFAAIAAADSGSSHAHAERDSSATAPDIQS